MPFVKNTPEWGAQGVKPPQTKLDNGWSIGERPPAGWVDWFFYTTAQILKELKDNAIHIDRIGVTVASITNLNDRETTIKNWVKDYGVGSNAKALTTTDNLNNISASGLYMATGSSNIPVAGATNVFSVVHLQGSLLATQTATRVSTGDMYTRQLSSGSWSSWKRLVTETETGQLANLQTTDKTSLVSAINEVKNNTSTTADKITMQDTGNYYTVKKVENALQELGAAMVGVRSSFGTTIQGALSQL